MGTDYIDLYQIHGFDALTPIEEILRVLDDLVHAGKVRYIGCSNQAAWQLMKSIWVADKYNLHRFESLQAYCTIAARTYLELMKVGCTGCGYCTPCPSDVMIPICFELYNTMHMFEQVDAAKFSYAIRMSGDLSDGVSGYASQCTQCGECLDKCPQHISIPDVLASVASEMDDIGLEHRLANARKMLMTRIE